MKTSIILFGCLLPLLVGATGCDHGVDATNNTLQPTFSNIQTTIFTPTCAVSGCHIGAAAPLGLDLSAGKAYANLVGVSSGEVPALFRVSAGIADSSYLVIKVEGGARMAPGTDRMPRGRDPLSADRIAMIREWIRNGAANN